MTKVRPNQIWQDHGPRNYNQTVCVVLTSQQLIGPYFSICNYYNSYNYVKECIVDRGIR